MQLSVLTRTCIHVHVHVYSLQKHYLQQSIGNSPHVHGIIPESIVELAFCGVLSSLDDLPIPES